MNASNIFRFSALGLVLALGGSLPAMAKDKTAIHGSIAVKGKSKSEYSALAKVSLQDAISKATQSTSGKVIEATLDRESGFLVYEIEVVMPDQSRRELLIDAGDGKILLTKDMKKHSSRQDGEDDEDEENSEGSEGEDA